MELLRIKSKQIVVKFDIHWNEISRQYFILIGVLLHQTLFGYIQRMIDVICNTINRFL